MPGLNPTARNALLDAASAVWPPDTISLHTADPGNTNTAAAGEVSGGSPAYGRKSITWAAASAGAKSSNAAVVFDVPGSTTITHAGYWRGSTYLGARALDSSQTFATQGTYTLATGSVTENMT